MVIRVITASLYLLSKSHEAIYSFTQTPLPSNLDWTTIGTNPKEGSKLRPNKIIIGKVKYQVSTKRIRYRYRHNRHQFI